MKTAVAPFLAFALLATTPALATGHDAVVRSWIVDPGGDVDGVVLSDRSTLRFDRMSAMSITHHVHIGDRIQITPDGQTLVLPREHWSLDLGVRALGGGPSRGVPPLSRNDHAADGMTVSGSTGRQHLSVRGVVMAVTYGRGHVADGFVLEGGITVRIASDRAAALSDMRPGVRVSVAGEGVRGRYGTGVLATRVTDTSGREWVADAR